ncbi:MAG: RagB/SusD family nutrient uptake outer membrane protein [Prevotellaceae bacterium]|nr:RagB/SusD family nutrient uptake outer membrane protein [Prevotellaceae bacterium]
MKKVLYIIMCGVVALTTVSCSDYLVPKSDSETDADFVFSNDITARAAIEGAYEQWRATANSQVFGAGLFYAADVAGSDIERHPEGYANQPLRHIPECFYENGTLTSTYGIAQYDKEDGAYSNLYSVIGKANAIITAIEGKDNFETAVLGATAPTTITQFYGEAVALRATAYRELIKYYGDVPYVHKFGEGASTLAGRDSIYDACIADLMLVEPNMYDQGSIPNIDAADKHYFTKQYVQGLIGRMALEAAGFQTRRTDGTVNYTNGAGEALSFEKKGKENQNAQYGRRSDYKDLLEIAQIYFKKVIDNPVGIKFNATDYQAFFQQMMSEDAIYADESIYEYPMQWNVTSNERAYSSGRPSNGGSKDNYPCKDYGQCRINPAYYYGIFDPQDKRRDVSVAVTGSDGKGYEVLIPFSPGSKASAGGLSMNKWDECRQTNPNTKAQRKSGINGPYMRISEIYLGYAEACALLNNDNEAKKYLTIIRSRAFDNPDVDGFIAKCGNLYPESGYSALYKAIIEERGFEFAGEGDRRWTLIRTGILPEAIKRIKTMTTAMMDGLAQNGSYTFENGNVISNQVYTKAVDAKAMYGYRLTKETPKGKEDDPVLYPGWRGQKDDWESFGCKYGDNTNTNLAIVGLFKPVSEAEASVLLANGYKAVDWGASLVKSRDEYDLHLFTSYDYVSTPIYLWPITPNQLATGGYKNGYGFPNTID